MAAAFVEILLEFVLMSDKLLSMRTTLFDILLEFVAIFALFLSTSGESKLILLLLLEILLEF